MLKRTPERSITEKKCEADVTKNHLSFFKKYKELVFLVFGILSRVCRMS